MKKTGFSSAVADRVDKEDFDKEIPEETPESDWGDAETEEESEEGES